MRFRAYALGLFLAILGPAALMVLPGCGSNGNLGGGLPDAATPLGGAGGSTSALTNTGGTLASGGAVQGGIPIAGGAVQGGISITGGAVQGGISINGGAVLGGGSGMGGAVRGGNTIAGGAVQGGSSGTGGSSQTGDAGVGGVTLSASVTSDGLIVPLWQNQSRVSIFLYGCGSANVWKKNGSDWVNRGTAVHCAWEGISPEVPAGSSYSDAGPAYAVALAWGPGTYRLQGNYGVGCTNPELGQSKAGCTAFYEAVSNEVTVVAVPDAGAGGAGGMGGGTGSGGTPTGGAAGAGTGGTNTGGAGGASTGGTAIGGAGGTAACQQVGTLDQSCLVDSDCLAVRHTTNCCGASVWLGINKAGAQEFSTLESVCDASYPACGCASGPPTTSDGSSIPFGTTAAVTCQGGVCKTYASACGHLCETGRSCITCGQADAGVSVCSLRCPSGTGCTEAAYSQCLSSFNGGVCVAPDLPCTGY